jgi:hypothetical protein
MAADILMNKWGQVWKISFFETPNSGWSFGHPSILTVAGQLGKVEYEAPAKTSCRIVMIVVILIN